MLSFATYYYYYFVASVIGKITSFFAHLYIPETLRPIIIRWYAWYSSSRTYEMTKSFSDYKSISEFFTREIKRRPIDQISDLVAPVDCTILSAGRLDERDYKIEQIKGIEYPMEEILGLDEGEAQELRNSSKPLYYVSIHLPVSECHRFRSPTTWEVKRRVHIPGTMFNLGERDLFNKYGVFFNERVVLEGEWLHGKFFFVPVGAKKVGSVVLNFDKKLKTNFIGESFRKEEED